MVDRLGAGRVLVSTPPARKPARDDSRGNRASRLVSGATPALRTAVLAAGVTGAVLLIVADLSTLIEVKAVTAVIKRISGGSQHSYAMLILGLFALVVTAGVVRSGSRPAMLALTVVGLIAGGVAVIGDLPDVHKTGQYGQQFESASASPKAGFYLETLGAALLIFGGGGALILSAPGRSAARAQRDVQAPAKRSRVQSKPPDGDDDDSDASAQRSARSKSGSRAAAKTTGASGGGKGRERPSAAEKKKRGEDTKSVRQAESRARAAERVAAKKSQPKPPADAPPEADGALPQDGGGSKAGAQARTSRRRRRR